MDQTKEMPSGLPKPKRHKSWLVLIVLMVLLTVVGSGVYRYFRTPATVANSLRFSGNVDVRQVNLSFKVPGRISKLLVDEGDEVKAGQVIATLDTVYFNDDLALSQAQKEQAYANYQRLLNGSRPEEIEQVKAQESKARATLDRAEQDMERAKQLIKQKAISQQEFDSANATYMESKAALSAAQATRRLSEIGPRAEDVASGQAQLSAADAQVTIAQRRLSDSKLVAPHDGIILTRAREEGAIVTGGEAVFTLTLTSPIWIRTYVSEPDLVNVEPGMKALVTTDTLRSRILRRNIAPAYQFEGRIGFISPTAEFTPKTVETRELRTNLVYRMRIVVENNDGRLRQGMPVTLDIELPGNRNRTFQERLNEAFWIDRIGIIK